MQAYQRQFIELALEQGILSFGEFSLKSGRISPYFFNLGRFDSGSALAQLGYFYASAIEHAGHPFDILFGPAYKGIPLVCATAISLATYYHRSVPYCFNRKEAKDHGEGGAIIGADLSGKQVMIVDDVITAGTAVREVVGLIEKHSATLGGIVIALDREERSPYSNKSAAREIADQYNVPVINIVSLRDVIEYLKQAENQHEHATWLPKIEAYRTEYGV